MSSRSTFFNLFSVYGTVFCCAHVHIAPRVTLILICSLSACIQQVFKVNKLCCPFFGVLVLIAAFQEIRMWASNKFINKSTAIISPQNLQNFKVGTSPTSVAEKDSERVWPHRRG